MPMLAGLAAVVMAVGIGYYFGRRSASTGSTWKKRTSRVALGRLAMSLLLLLTARRIRQRFRIEPVFTEAMHLWGLRHIAPVELLRGSVTRMRS
jgi:hypothetical protein